MSEDIEDGTYQLSFTQGRYEGCFIDGMTPADIVEIAPGWSSETPSVQDACCPQRWQNAEQVIRERQHTVEFFGRDDLVTVVEPQGRISCGIAPDTGNAGAEQPSILPASGPMHSSRG